MKLPNRDDARLPLRKLTEYLLSVAHPVGRAKAKFFRGLGFDENNAPLLQQGLLAIARNEELIDTVASTHGRKYVVDGELPTPAQGLASIRTVWIVEADDPRPRFVTAYPT
jgi:hypothetical protein